MFTGTVTICFEYDDSEIHGPESELRIYHYEGDVWVDVTVSVNTDNNIICAEVLDFSPFIVTKPWCCLLPGDIDHNGSRDISDLTYYVDYMFGGGPAAPCFEEGDVDGSGGQDISDLTYFVDFMFGGGPEPVCM